MNSLLGVPMIDGVKMGILISDKQYKETLKVLARYDGKYTEHISVAGKTKAQVLVNEFQGLFWLNIHCNPISFITGQNSMGTIDGNILVDIWDTVAETIRDNCGAKLLDDDMRSRIDAHLINVYQIAFASYTKKIPQEYQQHLIGFTYGLYVRPLDTVGKYVSADKVLGLRVEQGESGYSITFTKKNGNHKRWRLCIYNKAVELLETGNEVPLDGLKDCLRLDLTLTSQWIHDKTRTHSNKGMLVALGNLHELAMTQLASCLDATHFATLASPLSKVHSLSWYKNWDQMTDRQKRDCRAAGYRPELGVSFYESIEDVKNHTRSHVRQVYDAEAWARYVSAYVSRMIPVERSMGSFDGSNPHFDVK